MTLPTWHHPSECPYDVDPGELPGQIELDGMPVTAPKRADPTQADLFTEGG